MSATNERPRWQLTGVQRFLLVVLVVVALFLAAMALGSASLPLFLVAVALLAVASLALVLFGVRQKAIRHEIATADVVTVSPPPVGAIVGKCDLRLRVSRHGRRPVEVKYRDVALAVDRWPRVGQTLPVDIEPDGKHVKVRWDLIDQSYMRASDPTPPRSHQPAAPDAVRRETAPSVRLHTQYADSSLNEYDEDPALGGDYPEVRTPVSAVDPFAQPMSGDGHDRETVPRHAELDRPIPTGTPPLGVMHPDFDPADIDRSDFELDPTESGDAPGPAIPAPRPAAGPALQITGPGTAAPGDDATTSDADSGQIRNGGPIGGMLIVSDLDRSLRFYSETLGFTIAYAASSNAVVEYGGARILLQHMADFSGIDRKVGHLHIQVADLDAAYTELLAKGVVFRYRPKMVSRSDDLELWKAAFDDPDGHGVALAEWRKRR